VNAEYIILKETKLNNNCPECYSKDGMTLYFKQEIQQSKFHIRTKKNILEHIQCSKCENVIYPGQWTADIERVYSYHKKTITATSGSLKFTALFYILFAIILFIIVLAYILLMHPEVLAFT